MIKKYKKFFFFLTLIFCFAAVAGFQIAFINKLFPAINLFLLITLYLALAKKNLQAIIAAWLGGLITSWGNFAAFGTNSIVFLLLAIILIIFRNFVFLTFTTNSVILMGLISVMFYHFFYWGAINIPTLFNEDFYTESFIRIIINRWVAAELILTSLVLFVISRKEIGNA